MFSTMESVAGLKNCTNDVFSSLQQEMRLVINMPLSLFGMFTNTVNIVVFLDAEMRTQLVNHFLLALSVSDLLLLMFNFFMLIFPVIATMSSSAALHNAYPLILWYSYPLALSTQTCGVYLTVLVSVHRYLGVCHPFRAKRWVSGKPVRWTIVGSLVFSILINLVTWFELDTERCFNHVLDTISTTMKLTAVRSSYTYNLLAKVILYTLVMFVVPFTALIVVNCRIIAALRESSHLRSQHSSSRNIENRNRMLQQFRLLKASKYSEILNTFTRITTMNNVRERSSLRDRSVTLMLLAIVAIFLLCNCLPFCNNIVEITNKLENKEHPLFDFSIELGNVLISLNSSSSLFVYLIFSSKYRAIVKHWLGIEKRTKLNAVAMTTAMAAQKALELSILPDELDTRTKHKKVFTSRAPPVRTNSQPESVHEAEDTNITDDPSSHRTSSRRKLLRFDTIQ